MTAVGKWDIAFLEVMTNGRKWLLVTHPNGYERVFRESWYLFDAVQTEAGIQKIWDGGMGFDFNWDKDGKDLTKQIEFLSAKEVILNAMFTGKPYQEVSITFHG